MEKSQGKLANVVLLDKSIEKITVEVDALKTHLVEAMEAGATMKAQSELLASMVHVLEALKLFREELNGG